MSDESVREPRTQYGSDTENALNTKQVMIKAIERLPDDAEYDEAIERLLHLVGIDRGLAVEAGHLISHEDLKKSLRSPAAAAPSVTAPVKRDLIRSLERLPDNATPEEIAYRVYVVLLLNRRLANPAPGLTIEEVRERLKHWLD